MKSLFGDEIPDLPPSRRDRAHAAPVGSGPAGKTCGDCRHYCRIQRANVYRKCYLMREIWTGGAASDIRAGDAACKEFEQRTE